MQNTIVWLLAAAIATALTTACATVPEPGSAQDVGLAAVSAAIKGIQEEQIAQKMATATLSRLSPEVAAGAGSLLTALLGLAGSFIANSRRQKGKNRKLFEEVEKLKNASS